MADDLPSSDSEDEEYVPTGDLSSPSGESDGDDPGGVANTRQTRSRADQPQSSKRQRPKRSEEVSVGSEESSRIDDLWSSFKQDVEKTRLPTTSQQQTGGETSTVAEPSSGSSTATLKDPAENIDTVLIKTTYDFAGEDIEVEKRVSVDSKEAKKFLESGPGNDATRVKAVKPSTGVKRKGSGLNSVLQAIGKKQKMSTLEKSRIDWVKFKADTGLEDELAHNSKDSYLDKQEFLQRADERQFELEREERLKRFKRLY